VGVQAITRAAAGEYEPIPRVASDVPLALRQICERAMARDLADRYDSAEDIAQGLERSTALALRTSSTRVEWVAAGITAIATLGVGGAIGGMVSESPPFAAQGPAPYGSMAFTLLAGILAGVEYVTLGRHRLSTLVLGLGLSTAVLALATFGGGLSRMAMHLREVAGPIDPERVLAGVAEAGGSLATGASLAALQLVLWAALRRRSEMRHTS
jgi:hypothetical protein